MYQFTDDCLTGIEIIDNEHRRLFAMINEGIDMIHGEDKVVLAVAKDMVVQLKEYAVKHFADEEEIMEKLGDAELESYHDHRLAMSYYVAGLICENEIAINGFEWTKISFPEFEELVEELN